MRYKLALVSAVAVLASCATVSQMEATSGSRSDGIVKLSFEYGMFDKVQLDQVSAHQKAKQRCAVWGYSDAEPFGGVERQCQAMSGYGCMRWFATIEYQCTMAGGSAPALTQAAVPAAGETNPPTPSPSGPRRVRANTPSGYCLDVPKGYVGTGAENTPVVTSGMPRCDQLSVGNNDHSAYRPRR
jgi:hypothetical protein